MDWLSLKHRKISRAGATQHGREAVPDATRYACRPQAASQVGTQHMPDAAPGEVSAVCEFAREHENAILANGRNKRIADILIVSLPRDTSPDQRFDVCTRIVESVTSGRTPALFGIHDKAGNDSANPHAHFVIFDRDVDTGKRVFGFSSRGSTKRLRTAVADAINGWYLDQNRESYIDPRSFKERGLEREPTIHEGPGARRIIAAGLEPESRIRVVGKRNGNGLREVDYRDIDRGENGEEVRRMKANEMIRELNEQRKKARRYEKELARLREAYERAMGMIGRAAKLLGFRGQVKLSDLDQHLETKERAEADTTRSRGNDAPSRQRENDDAMEAELQAVMDQNGFDQSRGNGRGRARSR